MGKVEIVRWDELDVSSSNTLVEAVEVFGGEMRFDEMRFKRRINVPVMLQLREDDGFGDISRSIRGAVDDAPSIDRVLVDISFFRN